jgi:sugar phosphate isomerase/epimerase
MKLSLSCRIAESSSRKDVAALPIEELAPLAATAGFSGLSMRASAVSNDTSPDRVSTIRQLLDTNRLAASMVMGNIALAANNTEAPDCLRNITPHLDLAECLGAKLVRVMIQHEDDIPHAQRSADEAKEREISLSQQTHWGTLAETVDGTLKLARQVDRDNFGITFEPANLLACGEDFGPEAVRRLAPHLVNFYFQNIRLDPTGAHTFKTLAAGPVSLSYVALDDPSGIEIAPLIATLKDCGYDGWVSVHQPLREGQSVTDAIDEAARVFCPLVS